MPTAAATSIAAVGTAPSPPARPGVNLIAYADSEGHVRTVRPDGSSTVRISPDHGFFTWPMWSPDGTRIVFSGAPSSNDGDAPLTLYAYHLGDDQRSILYTNEPGMGTILPGMPHYPLWAPDGSRLAFMAGTQRGLALLITDPQADGGAEVVLRNAPLYASWSANSQQLVVHGGVDHFIVDAGRRVTNLGVRASNYRVPAWWPLGDRIALVSEGVIGKHTLYISDIGSGRRTRLDDAPVDVAFLWSPNGESLAVAHSIPGTSAQPGGPIYRGVTLYSAEGERQPVDFRANVVAFFWSPDSTKLAYVTITGTRGVLQWMLLDLEGGSHRPLAEFTPSVEQLVLFSFFDQFAYSHSMWSPDSGSLVFAGRLSSEAVSASLDREPAPQINVLDVEGYLSARPIVDGTLAVWSPR